MTAEKRKMSFHHFYLPSCSRKREKNKTCHSFFPPTEEDTNPSLNSFSYE